MRNTARCELPAATPLRTAAQAQYRRRYRSAFGHRRPPTGAPRPYLVHEDPGAMHPLTRWPWNTAHRAYHHSHDTQVWKASPRLGSGRVQTSISAPRPSNHQQCLPVHFVQPIVVDGSFNRLKPRAISGEMITPSGTGACEMRSTGTGSDAVFAHAAPHSGPCAVRPPHDDVPCRTDRGHLTIAGRDVSCATSLSRPRDERLSAVESSPIAGEIHRSTQKISGMYRPPQRNDCQLPRLDSDNDAHRCAAGDPVPLTGSLSEEPHRQPHLLSASQTDDPDTSMMFIADTMTLITDTSTRGISGIRHTCERMRSHARSLNPARAGALYRQMKAFSCDSAARPCAPVAADTFPGRLRPPSFTNRSTLPGRRGRSPQLRAPSDPTAMEHPSTESPRRAVSSVSVPSRRTSTRSTIGFGSVPLIVNTL